MSYRPTALGLLIERDPDKGRATLLRAFERAGADPEKAASQLKITRRTFDRWIRRLSMQKEIHEVRARLGYPLQHASWKPARGKRRPLKMPDDLFDP